MTADEKLIRFNKVKIKRSQSTSNDPSRDANEGLHPKN